MPRLETSNPNFRGRSYIKNLDDPNQSYQGPSGGFLNPGYQAASFNASIDWLAQRLSPDSVLRNSLDLLRTRSQAIVRDNDFARNIIRIYRNRIIGSGIRLQSIIKNGDVLDKLTNERIENLWERWKKPKNCTVTGTTSFDSLMRQIVNAILIDGEVFVRIIKRKSTPNGIPLQLQLISSEYCPLDTYPASRKGYTWNLGIEFDEWKAPVNYAFYTQHPNDSNLNRPQVKQYLKVIPADEIIHLKFKSEELPNTARGVPILYSSILTLKDLFDYRSIEVTRAQVASAVMGFVSTTDENFQPTDDGDNRNEILSSRPMMAGSFYNLDPNSNVDIPHIQSPSGQYGAFIDSNGACVASGCGVEYSALTADYSKSNYSSSRLSAITTEPTYKAMQQDLEDHFFDELYSRWISLAVLKLKLPINNRTLDDYNNYKIYWPSMKYIDIDKEMRANINAINSGIKTRSEVLAEQGKDFNDHLETLKKEKAALEEAGLDFSFTAIGSQIKKPDSNQTDQNQNEEET